MSYEKGPRGKPRLSRTLAPLEFNLSHSGQLGLIAATRDRSVGVDVEQVRYLSDLLELADQHFSPQERTGLRSLPPGERGTAFFRCWTRKEAVIKACGGGFSHPLRASMSILRPAQPARSDSTPAALAAKPSFRCVTWARRSATPPQAPSPPQPAPGSDGRSCRSNERTRPSAAQPLRRSLSRGAPAGQRAALTRARADEARITLRTVRLTSASSRNMQTNGNPNSRDAAQMRAPWAQVDAEALGLTAAGRVHEAIELYLKTVDREQPPAEACVRLAEAYARASNRAEAVRWALKVVDGGDDFVAWQAAANICADSVDSQAPTPRASAGSRC